MEEMVKVYQEMRDQFLKSSENFRLHDLNIMAILQSEIARLQEVE